MESNIETRELSFGEKLVSSIQGIKHYGDIIKESGGKAVAYLLLISLLFGVVGSISGAISINNDISEFISLYKDRCPNFEIKNGELSVDSDMPIVYSQDKDNIYIIDTTNSTNPNVLDSYNQGILIFKDKIIQKKSPMETQIFDFKSLNGITINKNIVNRNLPFIRFVIIFIFLGNMIWYFVGGLLSAFFLALFALIINAIFKTKLKYGQLYNISIYALTTPIIIDVIFKILSINHFSYYWLVYHSIAFAYICFALNKLKNSKNNTEII